MRSILLVLILLLLTNFVNAQIIQGKVVDADSGEELPFSNVVLEHDGIQIAGTTADLDGNYILEGFSAGVYTVRVVYVGYREHLFEKIKVEDKKVVQLKLEMKDDGIDFGCWISYIEYKVPLIDFENTSSGNIFTREEISRFGN